MEISVLNLPVRKDIDEEVRESKYKYSLESFIRMLPHLSTDGLIPVIRRILWTCYDNKLYNFTKVSKIAGLVAGWHPHGSASVENAIVRLARPDVTLNHPLLDSKGSFGNITDLNASASRYIEAKVSQFTQDVIFSLMDLRTLDMKEGESGHGDMEPVWLPSKVPVCLINGNGVGIAEAFTSEIPNHNLRDIVNVCIKYINNKNISDKDLAVGIYPDYISKGTIINKDEINQAYYNRESGKVLVRGNYSIDNKNSRILVTALPQGCSFDDLTSQVNDLATEKTASGTPKNSILSNVTNASEYMDSKTSPPYVVIQCNKNCNLIEVLQQLFKNTCLQKRFSVNLTGVVGTSVRQLTLKEIVANWYDGNFSNRKNNMIIRITKLRNEQHIKEGVLKIYDRMDDIISLIRSSNKTKDDILNIMDKKFNLTKIQAKAIYEMELGKLSKRSKSELVDLVKSLGNQINKLENDILRIDEIMIEDLIEVGKKYGWERKTKLESLCEEVIVKTIKDGSILYSRNSVGVFDVDNIVAGKKITNGFKAVKIDNKWVKEILGGGAINGDLKGVLVFFSNKTMSFVDNLSPNNWTAIDISKTGFITAICPIYNLDKGDVVCLTKTGKLKRFAVSEISNRNSSTGEVVVKARFNSNNKNIIIMNNDGGYLCTKLNEIPVQGRTASGVATNLKSGKDVSIHFPTNKNLLLVMTHSVTGDSFVTTLDVCSLKVTNKNAALKDIIKDKGFKFNSIGCVDLSDKNQIIVFVTENSTQSLKINNIRNLKSPRKISCNPLCFIPVSITE